MVLYVDSMDSTSAILLYQPYSEFFFASSLKENSRHTRSGGRGYVDVDTRMMMGDGTMLTGIQIMNKRVAFHNRRSTHTGNKNISISRYT